MPTTIIPDFTQDDLRSLYAALCKLADCYTGGSIGWGQIIETRRLVEVEIRARGFVLEDI